MQYKILALDVDGTLLDSTGNLRHSTREAVHAARGRGLKVVLCTGRRYRTTRPILDELGLAGPVVLHNGVVVKDAETGNTVSHRYLPASIYREVHARVSAAGPPLVYVDVPQGEFDIVTEAPDRAHPFQREYLADNETVTRWADSLEAPPPFSIIMLSCMADEGRLRPLQAAVKAALGERVRTNFLVNKNYRGHILEFVAAASGKWAALHQVAKAHGIEKEQIVAIGDDTNDAEMIASAGLGLAMGNAVEAVQAVADHVLPSNDEDGVARAIESFLLSNSR
jgi:Cof subfamily protein (haloacid dehalogenase superfamily)